MEKLESRGNDQQEEQLNMFRQAAILLYRQAKYDQAIEPATGACQLAQQLYGADDPRFASEFGFLGLIYKSAGVYDRAEECYRYVIDVLERSLGNDAAELATHLNNLGVLYKLQRRYEEAKPLYERALAIRRVHFEENSLEVANSLNNLAALIEAMGDDDGALPLYLRALEIGRALKAQDDDQVVTALNNVGNLYAKRRQWHLAEPLLREALERSARTLGKDHPKYAMMQLNLGHQLTEQGRYADASALLARALSSLESSLGADHPAVAEAKTTLARTIRELNWQLSTEAQPADVQAALTQREQVVEFSRALGETHPAYRKALEDLVNAQTAAGSPTVPDELGALPKASGGHAVAPPRPPTVETAVEVDLTGVDDSLKQPIMDALSALAETQRDDLVRRLMEDRPELRSRLQTILDQVYAVRVQAFGADLPGLLVAIESTGNPDHQVALCRKAIALVDRTGRPDMWFSLHWTLGVSLTQSAAGDRADNIEQAIESVSAALEVKATVVPATSWASALSTLGLLYRQRLRGDPSDNLELAIDAYERALQGSEHRSEVENYASTQNNLANAYSDRRRGDRDENLARAVFLHQQVLLVRTREAVPVAWASSQNNLGNAYARFERRERAANRERAIHAFQQALTVRTQERMPVKWAETMINLGNAWRGRIEGDRLQNLGEARASYRNALEVWTAESAPEHHYNTLNLLAVACLEHRDCAHFRLGPPLLRADLLLPLADEELAALVGDYPELAELWQARQAGKDPTVQSEIREMQLTRSLMTLFLIERADDRKRYLAVHQELASTQVDAVIGSTQQMLGSDGSGEWGEALLAMLEEKHLLTRWRSVGLDAALDERIEFEKLEDCAERLTAQLWTLPMGAAELPRFMGEVLAADDAVVARLGSVGSELQRRRYLARVRARTDTILSAVLIQQVYFPEVANVGMELVLRRKALEAEIWISQRDFAHQGRDPSLAAKHIELQSVRRRIAEKILAIAEDEDAVTFRRNVLDLRLQEEDLEAGLAELVPAANLGVRLQGVTRRSVAAALPGGAALIEYVRVAVRRAEGNIAPVLHYLALVMTGEQPNNARVIDLGPAEAIDGQVAALRAALTGKAGLRPGRHLGRKENRIPSFYSDAALALRSTVFDPLLTSLGETRIIYVAPDGDLARLPLGILPAGKGQFLIDDYDFRYLGAGRDLLRLGAVLTGRPAASLVMADPDYDLPGADGQPLRKVFFVEDVLRVPGIAPPEERPLEHPNLRFDALAGARAEGETVARQLGVTPLIGPAALKAALVACQSPRILHLATHGFFLEDYGSMAPLGRDDTAAHRLGLRIVPRHEDPLLRSWLALAGINRWLRHETVPKEAGNCVLTAMDAATLDLADTELVVLSACESGLGVIHVGEGVLGLRRAFALAGAQTVIMSLWQIPDQQTQELIVDFYKRSLQSGESRAAALRAAQLTMKKKYRDPFYWGAFVCEGEPGPFFTAPS